MTRGPLCIPQSLLTYVILHPLLLKPLISPRGWGTLHGPLSMCPNPRLSLPRLHAPGICTGLLHLSIDSYDVHSESSYTPPESVGPMLYHIALRLLFQTPGGQGVLFPCLHSSPSGYHSSLLGPPPNSPSFFFCPDPRFLPFMLVLRHQLSVSIRPERSLSPPESVFDPLHHLPTIPLRSPPRPPWFLPFLCSRGVLRHEPPRSFPIVPAMGQSGPVFTTHTHTHTHTRLPTRPRAPGPLLQACMAFAVRAL